MSYSCHQTVGIHLWTQSLFLFCPEGSRHKEDEKNPSFDDLVLSWVYQASWARELALKGKVMPSHLWREGFKGRFTKIEKQNLLVGGCVFLCSSLLGAKKPPRQWDSHLSHDTENEKPRKMSNLFIISITDDLPPSSLDICQGWETFLVVALEGEVEGGLLESSGSQRPGMLLTKYPIIDWTAPTTKNNPIQIVSNVELEEPWPEAPSQT